MSRITGYHAHVYFDATERERAHELCTQAGGISGMESARHVGARDDPEHGVVITEAPDAKALAQVGVQVDTGHLPSLLRDLGDDLVEEVVDHRSGVLAEQADPCFGDDVVADRHRVRASPPGIFFLTH